MSIVPLSVVSSGSPYVGIRGFANSVLKCVWESGGIWLGGSKPTRGTQPTTLPFAWVPRRICPGSTAVGKWTRGFNAPAGNRTRVPYSKSQQAPDNRAMHDKRESQDFVRFGPQPPEARSN